MVNASTRLRVSHLLFPSKQFQKFERTNCQQNKEKNNEKNPNKTFPQLYS